MAQKNKAYVFIGDGTTTGTPNTTTGRFNISGDLRSFETRGERDYFYDTFVSHDPNKLAYKTNLNDAKKAFFAGLNISQFNEYIKCVHAGIVEIHH